MASSDRPGGRRASRSGCFAAAALLSLLVGGCRFVPYAPATPPDQAPLVPQGMSEPVPDADANPLTTPSVVDTPCNPQGRPVVETDETAACEADPACTIRCASEPAPPAAAAEPVDPAAAHCLALAMYWEAKAEGAEGMQAVGHVVLNRMTHDQFPDSVCGVVQEGGESPPCQFSWYCDGRSDRPRELAHWETAQSLAIEILASPTADPTDGALFFHADWMRSPWRVPRTRTAEIGGHVFYR